jgi:hypothetical protein
MHDISLHTDPCRAVDMRNTSISQTIRPVVPDLILSNIIVVRYPMRVLLHMSASSDRLILRTVMNLDEARRFVDLYHMPHEKREVGSYYATGTTAGCATCFR